MDNENNFNRFSGNVALRKIPASINQNIPEIPTDKGIDKIKLIELSTAIDKWEKEILFAENGFYSLKGKEPQEKIKDYLFELKSFIESKINSMSFFSNSSKELAKKIKQDKINSLKLKLELYSNAQISEWEISTYEEALDVTIQRAVLYKTDPLVIETAFQNGITVLETISEKEDWSKKLFNYRKKQFVSDFYFALIQSFINDKDVNAYQYFHKYKSVIDNKNIEKIEKQVDKMRIDITAYNWAKEIFSYNITDDEFQKELNNIDDNDIKISAKQFYLHFQKSDKISKAKEDKDNNIKNWQEIIEKTKQDVNTAILYIDYSSSKENIKAKKDFINKIREFGIIKTDTTKFCNLFQEIFSDFLLFKDKDISNYRADLSNEDFQIFEKIQEYSLDEFQKINFDFQYAKNLIKKFDIKQTDDKYSIIKIYFLSLSEYKLNKKDNMNIETRQKILDTIIERFKPDEKIKKERNEEK